VLAELPVKEPAYMHSFGLSERWLVLAEFPLVVNPISIPLSGRPYIENYRWKPERGTKFTLIDRRTGEATGPFETDAFFCFHHVNAYEENGSVVVDACTFEDAGIIEDLYLDRLRDGKPIARAELRRFRIDLSSRRVATEQLAEGLELPRINYGRHNERPYRYVWGIDQKTGWLDRIVKVDVAEGRTIEWREESCSPGEPVFVPAPDAEAEDDGVLLSVVFDSRSGRSFMLVLDAAELTELARAEAPHHIPYGFHGQFVGEDAPSERPV
jgi:carotenoid cleavage dioxygenase-like enzyme